MKVTITGSGTPVHAPGRAGPGVLVETDTAALQIDVGRGTTLRMADAGFDLTALSALFITHHHSDHLVGLADLLMLRWLEGNRRMPQGPLPVIVPAGPAGDIAARCLDVWRHEIELRAEHTGRTNRPDPDVRTFEAGLDPSEVFRHGDVVVHAVAVDHAPVVPAVGYRIVGPSGSIVISGDTSISPALELLATNADILIHESMHVAALRPGDLSDPAAITAYHSDAADVGGLAARAGVGVLVLTHLIPPPDTVQAEAAFAEAARAGGFAGEIVVARDLSTVELDS